MQAQIATFRSEASNSPAIREVDLDDQRPAHLVTAIAWISAQSRRDEVFGSGLFYDPAWYILLELYVAHCRQSEIPATALAVAGRVAPTTGLRWITALEQRELVVRAADPFDGRRILVSLTAKAVELIERALDEATESDRKLGLERLRTVK